jgi:hypothetical protein
VDPVDLDPDPQHCPRASASLLWFTAGIRIGTMANISSIDRVPDSGMPTSRIILITPRQTNYIVIGCGGGEVGGEV